MESTVAKRSELNSHASSFAEKNIDKYSSTVGYLCKGGCELTPIPCAADLVLSLPPSASPLGSRLYSTHFVRDEWSLQPPGCSSQFVSKEQLCTNGKGIWVTREFYLVTRYLEERELPRGLEEPGAMIHPAIPN